MENTAHSFTEAAEYSEVQPPIKDHQTTKHMKTVIIERKNGRTTIEMPEGADIEEVLAEHEIVNYKVISIRTEQPDLKYDTTDRTLETGTIRFEELKDKMKVHMSLPWWSPTFYPATVSQYNNGFLIEINRKIQQQEYRIYVENQPDLDKKYFVCSNKDYKKDEHKMCDAAEKHAEHLLSLTGKKSWDEYFFPFEETEKQTDE